MDKLLKPIVKKEIQGLEFNQEYRDKLTEHII